jgi:hypothetical protein
MVDLPVWGLAFFVTCQPPAAAVVASVTWVAFLVVASPFWVAVASWVAYQVVAYLGRFADFWVTAAAPSTTTSRLLVSYRRHLRRYQ